MSQPAAEFRVPVEADIDTLAANMREQDVAELYALGHTDLREVVAHSVRASTWCRAAFVGDELGCIFGLAKVGTVLAPVGVPWMLGTPLVRTHRRILAKLAPAYIRAMLQEAPHLVNMVHAHNTVAVQWLKHVGFHLHPAAPQGPRGEPFHLFEMTAHV